MKEYNFTITRNYVSDWGLIEGVREILQNAIDSSGEMSVNIKDDILTISNKGIKLPIKSLLMGYGTKTNDDFSIGGKSEGSLLAIMVLIREGYNVLVTNDDEYWMPKFTYNEDLEEEILTIEVEKSNPQHIFEYEISGLSEYDIETLLDEFPILDKEINGEKYESVETQCGEIILDEKYRGRMFVEGLPIQRDDNFEFGYNFKTEYVKLDRDRKAINYYELRGLTAQSLVTAEECHPEIFKAISNSCVDAKDIEDVLDEAEDNFLDSYRTMYYEENNLKENTIVATQAVAKQLQQMGINEPISIGSEIESYLIAKANDKLDLVYEAKTAVQTKTKLENALDKLCGSKWLTFMELYTKIQKYLPKKWKKMLKELIDSLADNDIKNVMKYIPSNFDYTIGSAYELKRCILDNNEFSVGEQSNEEK